MNKSLLSQKYVPLHKLNEGHLGEVFLARQTGLSGFQREVVLRHIYPKVSEDPKATEIFLEEIQFASQLSHANIVHLYDIVEDEGSYFLVLERINGASLAELSRQAARRGKMIPLGLTLNIIAQVLEGLRYAHSFCDESGRPLQIVHRGICPTNVLVSYFGNAKLLDFGVARAVDHCRDEQTLSPKQYEYMPPEVLNKDAVDHRADLYSVGILLYELTVGQRLFRSSTFDGMRRLLDKPIAPPTYARGGYPADLENIVMRALERDPSDRFDDAEEMLDQLEHFTFNSGLRFSRLRLGQFVTRLLGVSTIKPFPEEEPGPEENSVPIADELGFDGKGIFEGGTPRTKRIKRRKRRRRQQEVERLAQEAIAELVPAADSDRENDTVEIPAIDQAELIAKSVTPLRPLSDSTMVVTDEQVEEEIDLAEEEPILQPKRSLFDKETVVQYVSERPDGQVTVRVASMGPRARAADAVVTTAPAEQEEVTKRKGPPDPSLDLKEALAEISTDLQTGEESDRRRIEALEQAIDDLGDETVVPLTEVVGTPAYETGPAAEKAEYLLVKRGEGAQDSGDELELVDGEGRRLDELEQSDLEPFEVHRAQIPTGKIISPIREDSEIELELDGETIILDEDASAIEEIADEDLEEIEDDGLDERTLEVPPPMLAAETDARGGSGTGATAANASTTSFTSRAAEPRPVRPPSRRTPRPGSRRGRAAQASRGRAAAHRRARRTSRRDRAKPKGRVQRSRTRR